MSTNHPVALTIPVPLPFVILWLVIFTFPALAQAQSNISDYDRCSPFTCGNLNFSFPFLSWNSSVEALPRSCGLPGYLILCDISSQSPAELIFFDRSYQVRNIYPPPPPPSPPSGPSVVLVDTQLIRELTLGSCPSLRNFTLNHPTNSIGSPSLLALYNLSLIECPSGLPLSRDFLDKVVWNYSCNNSPKELYVLRSENVSAPHVPISTPNGCNLAIVPVSSALSRSRFRNGINELMGVLNVGFPLTLPAFKECSSCKVTGGRCGYDAGQSRIVCFNKQEQLKKQKQGAGLIIGLVTGSCLLVLIVVILIGIRRHIPILRRNHGTDDRLHVEQITTTLKSTLVTKYSYSDIKKMTNGFKEKLGQGGYGSVYKGKTSDGRLVAVKLLDKSNNIGPDFVNEVATIGRIHHVNVINLLGFSWNRSKQALVYEYMPNGSLGDLLSNEDLSLTLGLARMLEIAVGIAHGIAYLHNGCETRILHLDIKPHNVLLDQNFNPKISDFGLAKAYSRSRSAVTMTAVRGTIGYIAPELFMRNIGNASHKSDVYSYGMLLLEMVGGNKNAAGLNKNTSFKKSNTSSEAYFPSWIYDKLIEENDTEITLEDDTNSIARKLAMVGLWCIQINPKDRPSMARVVEMLFGDVDAIEMPPKPFFLSFTPAQHDIDVASIASDHSNNSALPLASDSREM
uniref:non-specific serine/threonine protein kinase n=4 Tax=Rhizophora mucronata TaxID=61149 RepID=A0A2P2KA51_RHIMU